MEDPTRNYAIPSSAFSISKYLQKSSAAHSRQHLIDVNYRGSIFQKREFYKNATIFLFGLLLLLLLGFFIMTSKYLKAYDDLEFAKDLCISTECLRSAANLKLSMNEEINPCDDFYEFSCGNWNHEHPNHGWYSRFSNFQWIDEKISFAVLEFLRTNDSEDDPLPVKQSRDFFKSCLDTEAKDILGYSVIYKYLKEVALPDIPSFFKVDGKDDDFKFDWITAAVNLKKMFALNAFIQFEIMPDKYNRSNRIMYVGAPTSDSPLAEAFKPIKERRNKLDSTNDEELDKEMKSIIKATFEVVIKNLTDLPDEALLKNAVDSIWFILNNITENYEASIENITNLEDIDIKTYKVNELQKITDDYLVSKNQKKMIVWELFLQKLFRGIDGVSFNPENDYLHLSEPDLKYLSEILVCISDIPPLILELYNWWLVVDSMILKTTSEFYTIWEQTLEKNVENKMDVTRPESLDCARLTIKFMGYAVGYGIVDRTFANATKPKIERMLLNIKDSFQTNIKNIKWMDKSIKIATQEKAEEMIGLIGFPNWITNKTAIEIYYKNKTISPKTYLENVMEFVKHKTINMLRNFRKKNLKSWVTYPTTVNAYHSYEDNAISITEFRKNIPLAILTFPIYELGLESLNYGAIGSIIGHELTHGFDDSGRKYDKEGNYIQWWTNETIKAFEQETECFINQYENFSISSVNGNVDGKLTLAENLADNGGLHNSYLAYKRYLDQSGPEKRLPGFDKFTNEQLFFIAFGNVWCDSRGDTLTEEDLKFTHCPNKYRVLGTLQNSEDFARAFNCSIGTRMNPNKVRCKIW